jgi:hypothetical protein
MSRLFLAAASACLLLATQSATAEDAKFVKLRNADTGNVLAVTNNSEEAGARVIVAKDDGKNESQQWKLEKDGDHYKVVNRKSGKVLDVSQESTEEGGEIIQWDDKTEANDNQRWSWEGDGKQRRLKSKSSSLVLDVDDDSKVVQRSSADKAKAQLWEVVEVAK